MATSGSVNFATSRDELIKYAYISLGVVGENGTPDSGQITQASFFLNGIMKSWNAMMSMPLWALKIGYILPTTGTNEINLSGTGGHWTNSFVSTTLSADSAASDTTLDVDSITGISDLDNIGVELDDGTMHWTTVSGAPAAGVVTLTTGVTGATSSGNRLYAYTTKAFRPLRLLKVFSRHYADDTDTPVDIIHADDYFDLGDKTPASYPTQIAFEPQLTHGVARIYPRFTTADRILVAHYHRPIEDFDATEDEPDCPQEYYLPLVYELATALFPIYGGSWEMFNKVRVLRDYWLENVKLNNYEEGSIFIEPDVSSYYNNC